LILRHKIVRVWLIKHAFHAKVLTLIDSGVIMNSVRISVHFIKPN